MAALEVFEAAEANLTKLERLWAEIDALVPSGIDFSCNPEYEDRCRGFDAVFRALPQIDGWKPDINVMALEDIAQNRIDAKESGMIEAEISVEQSIEAPAKQLREYRFRFNQKRRELIRDALVDAMDKIDEVIRSLRPEAEGKRENESLNGSLWAQLRQNVAEIDALLGSSVNRPPLWSNLTRHLHFACVCDLNDIEKYDWPGIKKVLQQGLYGANEPLPIAVTDLSDLVRAKPRGPVTTKLSWANLDDETFERLVFTLISGTEGYENPEWLTRTRAHDRGRDLSVTRVIVDQLSGTQRQRVIIQCKNWLSKSVTLPDVSATKDQMSLWGPPRVDVLIVVTSGRFTSDAVDWVEKHNGAGQLPRIEMWPESHLERLLASRPGLIAEFHLR